MLLNPITCRSSWQQQTPCLHHTHRLSLPLSVWVSLSLSHTTHVSLNKVFVSLSIHRIRALSSSIHTDLVRKGYRQSLKRIQFYITHNPHNVAVGGFFSSSLLPPCESPPHSLNPLHLIPSSQGRLHGLAGSTPNFSNALMSICRLPSALPTPFGTWKRTKKGGRGGAVRQEKKRKKKNIPHNVWCVWPADRNYNLLLSRSSVKATNYTHTHNIDRRNTWK